MEAGEEKGLSRKLSADYWIQEMRERGERGEFEPWADLINEEDYRRMLGEYFGSLESMRGRKYMDIGAGFGSRLHDLLRNLGVEITNLDVAPEAIKTLKERGEKGIIADVFKLPLKSDATEGVISLNLINTGATMDARDVNGFFRKIYRILNPGGTFIQSHWGFMSDTIPRNEQIAAIRAAGFENITLIENQLTRTLAHLNPLSFISQKSLR